MARWWTAAAVRAGGVAAALCAATLFGACRGEGSDSKAGAQPASVAAAAVAIQTFQFQPSPLEVKPGVAITWTNQDQIEHTVTAGTPGGRTGVFDSPLNGKGATFTFTFDTPGAYAYFCARHESMRGEVRVQ